jgi:hypothetical protein
MPTDPASEVEPKFFLRSKTVLSALLLALPAILGAFDIKFTDADAQHWLERLTAIIGLLGVIYGRVKSTGPLHLGTGVAPVLLALFLAIALLGGCTAAQRAAYDTPEKRKAIGHALLADGAQLLGKIAIGALQTAVTNEINGGKQDFAQAAASGLWASVSAADVRKIVSDATGGAVPQLEDAAAKVVSAQLNAGAGEKEALDAVASVISATVLTATTPGAK